MSRTRRKRSVTWVNEIETRRNQSSKANYWREIKGMRAWEEEEGRTRSPMSMLISPCSSLQKDGECWQENSKGRGGEAQNFVDVNQGTKQIECLESTEGSLEKVWTWFRKFEGREIVETIVDE